MDQASLIADSVNIDEAKTHFSKLVERAEAGEEVPGTAKDQVWMSDDFDDPLPPEIWRRFDPKDVGS